ncbi:MAG: rhodanese-like domain-containing protein [Alcaligenaceae bacterium]|nr:rhodanese-like domain-containing protein [Alcaligenaceae bacterium]
MIQRSRAGAAISSTQAVQMMNHQHAVLIDVRTTEAYNAGHVPQARSVPLGDLEKRAGALPKNKPLIVICDVGRTAIGAATRLRAQGFTDVVTLEGGLKAWLTAGLPVTANKTGA